MSSHGYLSLKLIEEILTGGTLQLKRVHFRKASKTDVHNEILKSKYIAVNSKANSKVSSDKNASQEKVNALEESIQPPKFELFSEERILTLLRWSDIRKIGAGLNNLGNTCFLNSALQCLCYTPPLANFALQRGHSKECRSASGFCLFCELERHINNSIQSSGRVIAPSNIVKNLRRIAKHFKVGRQEDSHEFIRYLIDGIQKSCLAGLDQKRIEPQIAETTVVHKIFGGHTQSQVRCTECGYCSNTFEPFLDLCLEIQGNSVESSLAKFTRIEILDKDNKYKCPACKKLVKAQKQFTIKKAPNILTVQLKRFTYNSFFGGKIDKLVQFNERLDLTPFISKETKLSSVTYNLYAILVHSGSSTRSGHYYSFVKSSADTWYCMDDSSTRQVSLQTVLNQKAYMLFYIKNTPKIQANIALVESRSLQQKRKLEAPIEQDSKKQKQSNQPMFAPTMPNISPKKPLEVLLKQQIKSHTEETTSSLSSTHKIVERVAVIERTKIVSQATKTELIESLESGEKVHTWEGEVKTFKEQPKEITDNDTWNEEYDRGRTKKIKTKKLFSTGRNPYQVQANNNLNMKLQMKMKRKMKLKK